MYDQFYGLSAMPFQLTPDSRFFFEARAHSRASAHLAYGLAQGEGFIVITGEVGAGKTTLLERLVSRLDPARYLVSRVSTTQVSGDDLLVLAMAGFGLEMPDGETRNKANLLRRFEALLRSVQEAGRRCVLIVDEAQNLTLAGLEELRMLSNLSAGGPGGAPVSVLQTVLVGQPQFREALREPDLDQLRQRVLSSFHLGPMTEAETRAYIEHRLQAVGWQNRPRWDDDAFAAVFAHTAGVPRRINRLCGRVLLYGALEESDVITARMVDTTAEELQQDLEAGTEAVTPRAADVPAEPGNLLQRLERLEQLVARREEMFKRLSSLLGVA